MPKATLTCNNLPAGQQACQCSAHSPWHAILKLLRLYILHMDAIYLNKHGAIRVVCTRHPPGTTRHACRSHTSVQVDWLGRRLDSPPQDHCFEGIQHQQWWGCLSAAPYPTQQATGPAPGPEVATSWFLETMCGQKVCLGACLDGRATLEWALSNPQHVMGLHV